MSIDGALQSLFNQGLVWLADATELVEGAERRGARRSLARSAISEGPAFGIPEIDLALPGGRFRFGSIHEWRSIGAEASPPCTLLAYLMGRAIGCRAGGGGREKGGAAASRLLLWIGREAWPTPYVLEQAIPVNAREEARKILLSDCLFLDPPNDRSKLWAIETALASPAVAVVTAHAPRLSFQTTKRLQLAAERGASLGFLIRSDHVEARSAAASEWVVSPTPSPTLFPRWSVELLRTKGTKPRVSQWTIECRYEQTLSLNLPSPLVGEPRAEAALFEGSPGFQGSSGLERRYGS